MTGARTSMSVRDCRAAIVHEALLAHVELVDDIDQIAALSRLKSWTTEILGTAVADLVADGVITETATGRLCLCAKASR
jgi:hypothetical protein